MTRRKVLFALVTVALFGFVLAIVLKRFADAPSDPSETPHTDIRPEAVQISRGAYLATAIDCDSCHTLPGNPPNADATPYTRPSATPYATTIPPSATSGTA